MQEDRICGVNAVTAVFARRAGSVKRLFYGPAMKEVAGPFCAVMAAAHRPYRMLDGLELARAAGTQHHGGLVAVAAHQAVQILDPRSPPVGGLLLVLDRVSNPHNFGAIARSAAFFGVTNLVLHDVAGQAMPSDAAYRTAEGGLEHLTLFKSRALARDLLALNPYYRAVAATLARDAMPLATLPRDRPVALVLGNEETGIAHDVLAACRRTVRITGAGPVQSLNVAQAAAVLLAALSAS